MALEPSSFKDTEQSVQQAQTVGIQLADRSEASLRTGFVLWYGFKKLGKQVSFEYPGGSSSSQDKTFQVTLRGVAPWISSVRYERDDKDLHLLFTLSNGKLSEQDILLSTKDSAGSLSLIVGEGNSFHNRAKTIASILLDSFLSSEKGSVQLASLLFSRLQPHERHSFGAALPKGTFTKELGAAVEHLAFCLGEGRGYLVCFQEENSFSTRCLLRSSDPHVRNRLKPQLSQAEERGRWVLGGAGTKAPEEALTSLLDSLS